MYRLLPTTPPSPSSHYYPRLIAGTNLPTPKGWIAWLTKADCTHITFAQVYYTIEIQRHQKEMNAGCRVQDQLNINEPTSPYIIGRELNLRKLPGRQWESNPQPSEQLRPMTIKTSATTETATTAYKLNRVYSDCSHVVLYLNTNFTTQHKCNETILIADRIDFTQLS